MKLTAKTVDAIQVPHGKAEQIVYDDEVAGFGLRIREGGSRTCIHHYKLGTKNRRMTLGRAVKEAFPDIRKRVIQLHRFAWAREKRANDGGAAVTARVGRIRRTRVDVGAQRAIFGLLAHVEADRATSAEVEHMSRVRAPPKSPETIFVLLTAIVVPPPLARPEVARTRRS